MAETMRGYNGNLSQSLQAVRIERGLKGLLVRKRWSPSRAVPCESVRELWFQPSSRGRKGWPGYVLLVEGAEPPPDDFVSRVRDERTVTFLAHSDEWRSFAQAIAARCGVRLREFPAEGRSGREVVKTAR
jgi:hypothetical protein